MHAPTTGSPMTRYQGGDDKPRLSGSSSHSQCSRSWTNAISSAATSAAGIPMIAPSATRRRYGRDDWLADDEIDELSRDDDRLADFTAVQMSLYLGRARCTRNQLLLRQVGRDDEPVAHLAVDLHDE